MPQKVVSAPSSEACKPSLDWPLDGVAAEAIQASEGERDRDVGLDDF